MSVLVDDKESVDVVINDRNWQWQSSGLDKQQSTTDIPTDKLQSTQEKEDFKWFVLTYQLVKSEWNCFMVNTLLGPYY